MDGMEKRVDSNGSNEGTGDQMDTVVNGRNWNGWKGGPGTTGARTRTTGSTRPEAISEEFSAELFAEGKESFTCTANGKRDSAPGKVYELFIRQRPADALWRSAASPSKRAIWRAWAKATSRAHPHHPPYPRLARPSAQGVDPMVRLLATLHSGAVSTTSRAAVAGGRASEPSVGPVETNPP